jgi:hypothetical protein
MARYEAEKGLKPAADQVEWVQVLSVESLPGQPNPLRELLG